MKHDHSGHRQRMKRRFLNEGLEGFADHEIMEMLLYYTIPRKDTNEIGHALIKKFGSIANVLESDISELMEVEGINESSATMIRFVAELFRLSETRRHLNSKEIYNSLEKIGNFAMSLYIGETVEKVYMLAFDNSLRLKKIYTIAEGSVNFVPLTERSIIECALASKASAVVITHNHPGGVAIASPEDKVATSRLTALFHTLEINFITHILVAGNVWVPLSYSGKRQDRMTFSACAPPPEINFEAECHDKLSNDMVKEKIFEKFVCDSCAPDDSEGDA